MTLRIERAEIHHVALPLVRPFRTSMGVEQDHHALLIRLDSDGLEGWGEAVAGLRPAYSYETVTTALHVLVDFLVPELLSGPVHSIEDVRTRFAPVRGHPLAKAGLEMAIWDLLARQIGVSLREFLGGEKERVPVGVSLGIEEDLEALIELVADFLDQGYPRIKLKIEPGRAVDVVAAVRSAFPQALLQVDANSAFSLEDSPVFQELDEFGLLMIEQPLGPTDLLDHSELQRRIRTDLCLDESIRSLTDTRLALELGSCRVINIKPGRVGGLQSAVLIHDYCLANDVPVWCGGMLETGIGRAANLALASLPGFRLPNDISGTRRYYDRDIVLQEFKQQEGSIKVPTGPGLGVRVDGRALRQFSLHREVLRAGSTG